MAPGPRAVHTPGDGVTRVVAPFSGRPGRPEATVQRRPAGVLCGVYPPLAGPSALADVTAERDGGEVGFPVVAGPTAPRSVDVVPTDALVAVVPCRLFLARRGSFSEIADHVFRVFSTLG